MDKEAYEITIKVLAEKINVLEQENKYLKWSKEDLENKVKTLEQRPLKEPEGVEKR